MTDILNIEDTLAKQYGISTGLAHTLIDSGTVVRLQKSDFIFFQGTSPDFIIFPISGNLSFYPTHIEGGTIGLNIITPGIIMNEVQMFLGGTIPVDVRASSEGLVLKIPFSVADKLASTLMEFSSMLNKSMAKKQRVVSGLFHLRTERNHKLKTYKAIELLNSLSNNEATSINLVSLASLLNISRNTVSKAIQALVSEGAITKKSPGYWILH